MEAIRLEKIYKAPAGKVWKAITDSEQMKQWYFDLPGFRPEVGYEFEWYGQDHDCNKWLHRGKILEIIPGKKLVHSWEYPGYPGLSKITWELSEVDANTTRLNFSHEFTVPFDPGMKVFDRNNFAGGWDHFVNKALPGFVEK
jgi:uncharacterized protein YndB with AHSA1/START domain